MSLSKDRVVLINSIVGATVGIIANVVLVPRLHSIGSSYVWCISELSVLFSALFFVSKYNKELLHPLKRLLTYAVSSLPIAIVLWPLASVNINYIVRLIIGAFPLLLYFYILFYHILKEAVFIELSNTFVRQIKKMIVK